MMMLRELIFVVVVMLIIGFAGKAFGAECHLGPAAVWADHPGSWASWSHHIGGHTGSKCWYATWPTHGKTQVVEKSSTSNQKKSSAVSSSTPTSDVWVVDQSGSTATSATPLTRGSKHERRVVHATPMREGKHATPSYTATPAPSARAAAVPLPRARALSSAEIAKLFRDYQEWVTFGSAGSRPVWEQRQNAAP